MKNLTKLANSVPRAIGLGLAGAVLCGTMGCASMTRAQKTALLGQGLSILGSIPMPGDGTKEGDRAKQIISISGTVITNQAKMQHDLEYANAGKSQIIINNNPPVYQNQNQNSNALNNLGNTNNFTPEGFFMYKNFVDFNNDGKANRDEFIGLNESVYDMRNLDGLCFSFYGGPKGGYNSLNLNLKIYSLEDGRTILSFNDKYADFKIQNFDCMKSYFPKSGKYKAVLNIGSFKNSSLDFEIIK